MDTVYICLFFCLVELIETTHAFYHSWHACLLSTLLCFTAEKFFFLDNDNVNTNKMTTENKKIFKDIRFFITSENSQVKLHYVISI